MPATNQAEAELLVAEWQATITLLMQAMNRIRQIKSWDQSVGQDWDTLFTDVPSMQGDNGAILNKFYTPAELKTAENRAKQLLSVWDNEAGATVSGNLEQIFRKISGITA